MNLKSVLHRVAQGCGVCLPLLLVVGLLVPGCAGKRSDMLSSLIKPKQADTAAGEADADEQEDEASGLIAGADDQQETARLSAFSAEEIIEGRPRFGHRVRSLFTRNDESATAGDPFLNETQADPSEDGAGSAEDRKAIASSENARVAELLASFETEEKEPISEVKPWWETPTADKSTAVTTPEAAEVASADDSPKADPKTTFSTQFDSRLQRLRAELELDDKSIAETAKPAVPTSPATRQPQRPDVDEQPTIEPRPKIASGNAPHQDKSLQASGDHSQDLPIVIGNARTGGGAPSSALMMQPRHPLNASQSTDDKAVAEHNPASDAKQRVVALMDDARQDWQAWKLHRAYHTVVAAHKLATREKVRFQKGEEQPRDLARKIVADLKKDALVAKADKAPRAMATNPFKETDELGIRSAAAAFGFEDLERLANPWTAKKRLAPEVLSEPALAKSDAAEPIVESHDSGVSLLPPDDDFPSDASQRDWSDADPRDIRLANHSSFDLLRSTDRQVREQMRGLSEGDNDTLLQNVADQKNRVLKSNAAKWPQLPSAHRPALRSDRDNGPIRVAEAPRFALEDDVAIAAVPSKDGAAAAANSGGSLLGQFWRSQPIWFIGGLVLLVIALRLWPSVKQEEA